jgi:hypothetical protein
MSFTLVFLSSLVEHTLCLEQLYGCLFHPVHAFTGTTLQVTYSGQTRGWPESTLIQSWGVGGPSNSNHRLNKIFPGKFWAVSLHISILFYIRTSHSSFKSQDLGVFQKSNPKDRILSASKFLKEK